MISWVYLLLPIFKIFQFFKHFIHSYSTFCLIVPISEDLTSDSKSKSKSDFIVSVNYHLWWLFLMWFWQLLILSSYFPALNQWKSQQHKLGMLSFMENLYLLLSGARGKLDYFCFICILIETWNLSSSSPTMQRVKPIIQFLELA